ncbi:MAG TPA: 3-hydroxyacyl-ACP dehydratase FabZ [Rectinemataceae bacterium]|nr:3-hydroxyacyl-ACP dehydratase FabZ [Rectinemataceae bacterium]
MIDADDPRKEIKELLPHREPFLYVDKVEIVGSTIHAERTYPDTEFFFAGHFPGYPVVPGVILVETMAQCGGVGIRKMGIKNAGTFMFAKIKEARFRRPVRPGETFRMEIVNLRASPKIIHQKGTGYVGDDPAVDAEWIAIVGDSEGN